MLKRILIPPQVPREEFTEEHDAWEHMITMLGINEDPQIETHPKECKCPDVRCHMLLSIRRYVVAHIKARRIRYSAKALQSNLDEFVKDENEAIVDSAHAEALLINNPPEEFPF